jgi:glycosyltransferase involved in cell wall biosynthesis
MAESPESTDIVLCHDLGPITHPDLFGASTEASYRRAYDLIRAGRPGMVFVSQASRDAFVEHYGDDYRFLEVIPLFVRPINRVAQTRPPAGVAGPFLLTVGALERRKNHLRCFEAFVRSGLAERGYQYVFCGPRGNAAEEIGAAARATPGALQLGYVSDAELHWLYENAAGFVLPSLLEGFGIPALEAAQYGLVSLVGSGGAQREAVGDGAIFVDENSVEDIAEGMLQLCDMPAPERDRLVRLARAHAVAHSRERFVASWRALLRREVG